ncbi:sterol desaturase family protein [bacterium]|jgi:sterol desaturase/sphingolipid hydroxylase (fatty acid hydroxylase superfamily)|nr:sterol desaturase family protein [bacterium]
MEIRLVVFLVVFAVMAVLELLIPKRPRAVSKSRRWVSNISLVILNTICLKFLFPAGSVGFSLFASEKGWGLLNQSFVGSFFEQFMSGRAIDISIFIFGVVLLDMAIYWQHLLFHKVPILWRLHRVHHADLDLDVTSGTRFHIIEMVLSMGIKWMIVVCLGLPVLSVIVFEIILNGMAMFNHSNVRFNIGLDRFLRLFVVTPDMHRIHHSVKRKEADSNYGFNLSIWDRVFGSYTENAEGGDGKLVLGEPSSFGVKRQSVFWMLGYPFR